MLVAGGCSSPPQAPLPVEPRAYSAPAPPRPGLHGSALVSTVAVPGGSELSQETENTIVATTDLSFAVMVENSGEWPERDVQLVLTIQQSPNPIVRKQVIPAIEPGERMTITFDNLGQVEFATRAWLKVDVRRVPGEENIANNYALYPVVFSLENRA
jgi:hypothetical protein